jgi:hypothetical protein
VGAADAVTAHPPARKAHKKCLNQKVQAFETVEKGIAFFDKRLRPAAAQILSAVGGQNPRLQAEQCFFRRTCRRKKRI